MGKLKSLGSYFGRYTILVIFKCKYDVAVRKGSNHCTNWPNLHQQLGGMVGEDTKLRRVEATVVKVVEVWVDFTARYGWCTSKTLQN
jgi:hypothetical protein